MYLSYNWLSEFVDIDVAPSDLENILTMLGIEVEGIIDYRIKYDKFYTAKVLSAEKHPDADKLTICKVSTGSEEKSIVCGAPNVATGQSVILGIIGAIVPSAGFKLEKMKIRGALSEGMICSQTELEVGDDSSGIWVLDDNPEPGIPLSDYLGLNDIVYDVSLTPNRADCLSHFGVARDLAAYFGKQVKVPEIKVHESNIDSNIDINISIDDIDKCPRYSGRVIRNIEVKESPQWLKRRLTSVGLRPKNNIVDITNYVLMEFGQPLHAFDLDKIEGSSIIVKTATDKEKFITLDGKERILDDQMLMICDSVKSVAIGGVMGGANTEISSSTKNLLLESAYFDPGCIRRTSKLLGIQSDASYRFERGVDHENIIRASDRAAMLISKVCDCQIQSKVIDIYPKKIERKVCKLRYQRANEIIGIKLSNNEIRKMISGLGFVILNENESSIQVEVPGYRVDIESEIDLIEEVARLYNYDNIEPDFTSNINFSRSALPVELSSKPLKEKIRNFLVPAGFNEIITQNQTDPNSAEKFDENPIRISNPLGEELSLMRTSLIPSMLKTIERNHKVGNTDLQLFEIGKTFRKSSGNIFIDEICESEELIIGITGNRFPMHWSGKSFESDFYDLKGIFESLMGFLKIENVIRIGESEDKDRIFKQDMSGIYHNDDLIGRFGEINVKYLKTFDIESKVFIIYVNLSRLFFIESNFGKFDPVPPFPSVSRDLGFIMDNSILSEKVKNVIVSNGGSLLRNCEIFDLYKGKGIEPGSKSIAFGLEFSASDRTLTDAEVDKAVQKIVNSVESKFQAILRKA